MGVSATIGISILIIFSSVARFAKSDPLIMIAAWIIGAVLVLPDSLVMSEPAISFKENGAVYFWLKKAKWKACSFWFGWVLILMFSASAIAAATIALGNVIAILAGIDIINEQWKGKLFGITILAILAISQIFMKNFTAKSQILLTGLKFLPIVLVLVLALFYGRIANFRNAINKSEVNNFYEIILALIPTVAFTIFAYTGIEAIAYVGGEVENPRKNIPKALVIATIIIVSIYIALAIAILLISEPSNWKDNNNNNNVWFNALAANKDLKIFAQVFSWLSVFIFIGSINAFLFYQSRIIVKMSEERDVCQIFQKRHKKTSAPYYAIMLLVSMALVYILWKQLNEVVGYFLIAISLLKLIMLTVIAYLRVKNPEYQRIYHNYLFWTLITISYIGAFLTFIGSIYNFIIFLILSGLVDKYLQSLKKLEFS